MHYSKWIGLFCLSLTACGSVASDEVPSLTEPLAAASASGVVPSGLPARLMVGLFEDSGQTWMKNSGARWDVRYRYFTKDWVNNWGYSAADGSFGLDFMKESDQQGYLPAIQYYQLFGEPGGGESETLHKVQNGSTMASYFRDFKTLMQRVKDFGKPTLVLLEADAVGFLEQQSNHDPNAYAAIAASGMSELAGLPNTVAGFGLAYLKLKQAVGASNAVLGLHVSAWASGKDVASYNVTEALQPEVDKVYGFLAPLGLTANVTGIQYDVLVGDPLDRDADYYSVTQGSERTWDPSDSASISSRSFNRYAQWLKLWNQKATKRWLLWQIPVGNSNHKDVWNNGGSAEGYKDNRPEYFFSNGSSHLAKFADAGVIGLLFGAGAGGQSSYQNDVYSDGQLFMRSRAGAFVNAGGLAISTGGSSTPTPPPVTTATAPSTQPPPTTGSTDSAQYGFESSTQAWAGSGSASSIRSSTARAFSGSSSLRVDLSGSGNGFVKVTSPAAGAGSTVSFHVWVPTGSVVSAVQPYVLQGAAGGWTWTGNWQNASSLKAGSWNTLVVRVPAGARALSELGVMFEMNGTASGTAYVDSVSW